MIHDTGTGERRALRAQTLNCDLAIIGGGLAGTCAAITAARQGLRVVLVQDRPVLGGNASSEVRLWVLGATAHMGNNNRWARESGVVDEVLLENQYRNPEGNPLIFDTVLLELVVAEPNITLLLNTAAFEVETSDADTISAVRAFCSQNSTMYEVRAPLFCDASGDGVVGFLAGAAFRMGAESREEFGEKFAPDKAYGELLGHSIYFYSKDTGRPVRFTPPSFALKDISAIPRWRKFNVHDFGCKLWWIEYGGRLDTIHDTETIKWELWKVVYGVWDHIKNSGQFPEAENLTLEWVGTIPGKRESRRFEGDYILTQHDIVEQRRHHDDVSFGGWSIDVHPGDGVYSPMPGCWQEHSKGLYPIPYRCMYSRNIPNLFLAGRIISATHVAFASTRVMGTCALGGQAIAVAAALCKKHGLLPRDLAESSRVGELQLELVRKGQFIPYVSPIDEADLSRSATVAASSTLSLDELPAAAGSDFLALDRGRGMLVPCPTGQVPAMTFRAKASGLTKVTVELRACSREDSFTPDEVLESHVVELAGGSTKSKVEALVIPFRTVLSSPRYVMVCLMPNPDVALALSDHRLTGILSLRHAYTQRPKTDIGIDIIEMWLPERRPGGRNFAMSFQPPVRGFGAEHVATEPQRPTNAANAWIASFDDAEPWIEFSWPQPREIREVTIYFDCDYDHPMESVLMGQPEREMPFCVRDCRITDDQGRLLAEISGNHQTLRTLRFEPARTTKLRIAMKRPSPQVPASLFRVRIT